MEGIRLSRWRRHRDVPFGQSFNYTDSFDLKTQLDKRAWWKFWKPRKVVAWVTVDSDTEIPQAYICPPGKECKVNSVQARAIIPVYDESLILGANFLPQVG